VIAVCATLLVLAIIGAVTFCVVRTKRQSPQSPLGVSGIQHATAAPEMTSARYSRDFGEQEGFPETQVAFATNSPLPQSDYHALTLTGAYDRAPDHSPDYGSVGEVPQYHGPPLTHI
jgi:hypothetical protein